MLQINERFYWPLTEKEKKKKQKTEPNPESRGESPNMKCNFHHMENCGCLSSCKENKLIRQQQKQPQLLTRSLRIHQPWLQQLGQLLTMSQRTTPSRAAAESSANEKDADHETPAAKYSSSSRMKGYVYVEVDPYDNCTLDMTPLAKQKKKEEEAKKLFYI